MWPGTFSKLPLLCTLDKYSICTYTCLSYNLLISSWISMKFASVTLLCMLYLWSNFQLKANSWMHLREASTLLVDYSHNMNNKQMIYMKFQIYWWLYTSPMSAPVHIVMYIKTYCLTEILKLHSYIHFLWLVHFKY